jgi:hypothetical protein
LVLVGRLKIGGLLVVAVGLGELFALLKPELVVGTVVVGMAVVGIAA